MQPVTGGMPEVGGGWGGLRARWGMDACKAWGGMGGGIFIYVYLYVLNIVFEGFKNYVLKNID
jgi:hypothetical protein